MTFIVPPGSASAPFIGVAGAMSSGPLSKFQTPVERPALFQTARPATCPACFRDAGHRGNERPMTARLDLRFQRVAAEGRAALVTFTMAGDPDAETSSAILAALPRAGVDAVELCMPFTDPI